MKEFLRSLFYSILCRFPKAHADYLFKRVFHHTIDWQHPRDFNEWIRWEMVNTDISRWTDLADKYRVREYIKECGLEDILVKLYGVYDSAFDIDFDQLPDRFILKVNHGSGEVFICRNHAEKIDLSNNKATLQHINKLLKKKYGRNTGELHYLGIKPKIIIEELLDADKQPIQTNSIIDYKFTCIGGEPTSCFVVYNRGNKKADIKLYDNNWKDISYKLQENIYLQIGKQDIPKPKNLDTMLKYVRVLSKTFPQVRVDLYEVNNHIYFGELTFAAASGLVTSRTPEYIHELGLTLCQAHNT